MQKHWNEDQNMNKAPTDRFLSLMPTEHQREYAEVMTRDPNRRFKETHARFHTEYGHLDEVEVTQNKEDTKKRWHPSKRF